MCFCQYLLFVKKKKSISEVRQAYVKYFHLDLQMVGCLGRSKMVAYIHYNSCLKCSNCFDESKPILHCKKELF